MGNWPDQRCIDADRRSDAEATRGGREGATFWRPGNPGRALDPGHARRHPRRPRSLPPAPTTVPVRRAIRGGSVMSHPWDRRPEETEKQWAAFRAFRDLPSGERTLDNAYRRWSGKVPPAPAPTKFRGWAKMHDWDARVRAYDARLSAVTQEAIEAQLRAAGADWASRRE